MKLALLIWLGEKSQRNFEKGQLSRTWGLPSPQNAASVTPDVVLFGRGAARGPRQQLHDWVTQDVDIWVADFVGSWYEYDPAQHRAIWPDPESYADRFSFKNLTSHGRLPLAPDVNFRQEAVSKLRIAGGVGTKRGEPTQAQVVDLEALLFLKSGPIPVSEAEMVAGVPLATNGKVQEFDPASFDGELQDRRLAPVRLEQRKLRSLHIPDPSGICALCSQELPADLLVAAHIKKRTWCTDDEKRDLRNVAMVNCILGCDALYEKGYVGVRPNGQLAFSTSKHAPTSQLLKETAQQLPTRTSEWRLENRRYFAWHLKHVFR